MPSRPKPSSQDFRPLSDLERRLLQVLLRPQFPGKDDLAKQALTASVRGIDNNGSLAFAPLDSERASVVRRIPVEAELDDDDGVTIHLLLHVVNGFLNELEIYRDDSANVRRIIAPEDLRLIVL